MLVKVGKEMDPKIFFMLEGVMQHTQGLSSVEALVKGALSNNVPLSSGDMLHILESLSKMGEGMLKVIKVNSLEMEVSTMKYTPGEEQ